MEKKKTCTWCGRPNHIDNEVCEGCDAYLLFVITTAMIDFSGIKSAINLTVMQAPMMTKKLLPSRLFNITFDDGVACLEFKVPESEKKTKPENSEGSPGNVNMNINGNVTGNILIGNNIISVGGGRKKEVEKEEAPLSVGLWLPEGIENILITGNGKVTYKVDYLKTKVTAMHAAQVA